MHNIRFSHSRLTLSTVGLALSALLIIASASVHAGRTNNTDKRVEGTIIEGKRVTLKPGYEFVKSQTARLA